jgi:RNA recognition motif-containing protein
MTNATTELCSLSGDPRGRADARPVSAPWSSDVDRFDRIFVGGLPRNTTEEMLRAAFALGGSDVGAIEIMRNRATGLPRGFAFVKLLARFDVSIDTDALDRLASTTMEGRPLDVQGVPERPRRHAVA